MGGRVASACVFVCVCRCWVRLVDLFVQARQSACITRRAIRRPVAQRRGQGPPVRRGSQVTYTMMMKWAEAKRPLDREIGL